MLKYKNETIGIGHVDLSKIDYAYDNSFVSINQLETNRYSNTTNGVTCKRNADGTYILSGTATVNAYIVLAKSFSVPKDATKYKVIGFRSADNSKYFAYITGIKANGDYAFVSNESLANNTFIPDFSTYSYFDFGICVKSGQNVTGIVVHPMITTKLDATYDDYTPYAKSNAQLTKACNDDLKMLGWTVPSECTIQNYTDSNGVFHKMVGRVDLGTLSWTYDSSSADRKYFYAPLTGSKASGICYTKNYTYNGSSAIQDKQVMVFSNSNVIIKDLTYSDATTFKSAMSGVYFYYELDTEVTKSDGNEIGFFVDITDKVTFNTTTFTAGNTKVYRVGNRVEVVFSNATIKTTSDNQVIISNVPIPAYYGFSANVTDYGSGGTQTGKAILLYAHKNGTIMSSNIVNQAKLYGTLAYTME